MKHLTQKPPQSDHAGAGRVRSLPPLEHLLIPVQVPAAVIYPLTLLTSRINTSVLLPLPPLDRDL
jgi:hypothetical protein